MPTFKKEYLVVFLISQLGLDVCVKIYKLFINNSNSCLN